MSLKTYRTVYLFFYGEQGEQIKGKLGIARLLAVPPKPELRGTVPHQGGTGKVDKPAPPLRLFPVLGGTNKTRGNGWKPRQP
jgi:hypothetical protein